MFAIVFQQVFIMFLLMLIGFVYAKATGMQKAECNRICNILLMIVTPCLLLSNLQRPFQQEIVKELLFSLGLAVVSSLFAILAARFLFLPRGQQENKRIERYAASFGNRGLYWDSVGNRHFRLPNTQCLPLCLWWCFTCFPGPLA